MNIDDYQELTGITVSSSQAGRVSAQIRKTQRILEALLGYSLDPELLEAEQYNEEGKSSADCFCGNSPGELSPPDAVVFAYRLFPYNSKDVYLHIDPASAVHAVKLVKDGVTYKTLEPEDYRVDYKNGIVTYLEQSECWCSCILCGACTNLQLAVDATWLWPENEVPEDLLDVWCDMVTYYSDRKSDIKSETLGSHSYTKFNKDESPELLSQNIKILEKYVGPNGTLNQEITV